METQKHTPGPWTISNNIGRKGELGILADGAPCIIAIMGNVEAWPLEAQANARLIAKAWAIPELIEACKAVLRSAAYESGEALPQLLELRVSRKALDAMRAAIRKATE